MSETRTSYALPKLNIPAKIADVSPLSDAEVAIVLFMRAMCDRQERPLIMLEFMGGGWRIHRTAPGKWLKL